jgi:hypothetical protein
MSAQQPDNTEETYLPSASGVQDFYPPLDKDSPLPAKDTTEDDVEKKPASPSEKKPAAAAVAKKATEPVRKAPSKPSSPVTVESAAKPAVVVAAAAAMATPQQLRDTREEEPSAGKSRRST